MTALVTAVIKALAHESKVITMATEVIGYIIEPGADLSGAALTGANIYNAIGVEGLSQEQLASTVSKVPTPTIDLNDVDGVITADEVGGWAGLSGTAYPNTTLTLVSTYTKNSDSQSYQILTDTNGTWRLTKDDVGYNPPEGTYSLSITAKDGDGLVSEQAATTLTFDLGTAGTDFDAPTISLNDPNNDGIIDGSEYDS